MPIVGFNFDKIIGEKKKPIVPPVNVNTGVVVKDMKKEDAPVGTTEAVIRIDFEFNVKYDPKIADIKLGGHLLYLDEAKKVEKVLKTWKKDQKIEGDIMQIFMNTILLKSNIKALQVGQDLNLPPHLRLPIIQPHSASSKKTDKMVG